MPPPGHQHFSAFINLALGQHLVTHDAVVSIHVFVTIAMGVLVHVTRFRLVTRVLSILSFVDNHEEQS